MSEQVLVRDGPAGGGEYAPVAGEHSLKTRYGKFGPFGSSPIPELIFRWSRGRDRYDVHPEQRTGDCTEFQGSVLHDRGLAKGEIYICAAMENDEEGRPRRGQAFALARRFFLFDFDVIADQPTLQALLAFLSTCRGFGYHTTNSTFDAPRLRWIWLQSRDTSQEETAKIASKVTQDLAEQFGTRVKLDHHLFQHEQIAYTPLRGAKTYSVRGHLLDVDVILGTAAPSDPVVTPAAGARRKVRGSLRIEDPVIRRLQELDLVRADRPDCGVDIECPFDAEHSMDGGAKETVYWPPHTGGHEGGHFHCFHASCSSRSNQDFHSAIGVASAPTRKAKSPPPVISPRRINGADLLAHEFEPIAWLVDGLIPEGLHILAAAPKKGKSWFVLQLAIACGAGGQFLGRPVRKCSVLYLALEDNERRLQQRVRKQLGAPPYPDGTLANVEFWTTSNRADNHGLDDILRWLDDHPDAGIVAIDTLQCFRPSHDGKSYLYADDYNAMQGLRRLLEGRQITVIVVHHTRKLEAADPMDLISGSHGITGAADGLMLIERNSGDPQAKLRLTGRDIPDDGEYIIRFDYQTCVWNLEGRAVEVGKTEPRQRILDVVRENGAPMRSQEIATALKETDNNIRQLLRKLVGEGQLIRAERGRYRVPDTIDNE